VKSANQVHCAQKKDKSWTVGYAGQHFQGGVLLVPKERVVLLYVYPKHLNQERKQETVKNKKKGIQPYSLVLLPGQAFLVPAQKSS
jgi:hypothetical protein